MAVYINNQNVSQSNHIYINNQDCKSVIFNGVQVWKRERNLFYNGAFGELGTPTMGYSEGYSFRDSHVEGAGWVINCDGRCDWWFPAVTTGYSNVNIKVVQRFGAGTCIMFASYTTSVWGNAAPIQVDITTPGTYTMNLPANAIYVGVQALKGGVYIERVWQN